MRHIVQLKIGSLVRIRGAYMKFLGASMGVIGGHMVSFPWWFYSFPGDNMVPSVVVDSLVVVWVSSVVV